MALHVYCVQRYEYCLRVLRRLGSHVLERRAPERERAHDQRPHRVPFLCVSLLLPVDSPLTVIADFPR